MFSLIQRYYYTLRYLKPVQIYGRLWFRLYIPKPDLRPAPALRSVAGQWLAPVAKQQSLFEPRRFCFLGKEGDLEAPSDWNHPDWEKLWLYNLHYLDDLTSEGAGSRSGWHRELLCRWVAENPPGLGNGWEPYPVSLRIVNLVKWCLAGNPLPEEVLQSLAVQARYLSNRLEYHLLGNHLFANAKALVFAGLFFGGVEAQRWLAKGLRILTREVPEQILDDGGHFERSPMYHAITLEDLLDLINVMGAYGQPIPQQWPCRAQQMLGWLSAMCHPDGGIALFNDAAFGIAPQPEALFAYAGRLGFVAVEDYRDGMVQLQNSGYIRLQKGGAVALLDVAPVGPDYIPGHAHADTLGFELSLYGQRVLVDSGTSCYGVSAERLRQRSTAAHNTVTIDAHDSSEVWGGFRVARRARPFDLKVDETGGEMRVSCAHDGYRRLCGRPVHRRQWLLDGHGLRVRDIVEGTFREAVGRYYFHPDLAIEMVEEGEGRGMLPGGQAFSFRVNKGLVRVADTTYHPGFNISLPNRCLEVVFDGPGAEVLFCWE